MNSWTESVFDLRDATVWRGLGGTSRAQTAALWARRELASIVVILGAAALFGLSLLAPTDVDAPAGRAAIETAITLSSLLTVTLLALRASQTRQLQDRILLAAVVALSATNFAFSVIPALLGSRAMESLVFNVMAGLLLADALRRHAAMRREIAQAALAAERQRIARDLHDGLAQDLAFIAAYGQRLGGELGDDHPLIVASARALAATRGALVDLSASTAPSTATALTQVASELASRFHASVNVRVEQDGVRVDEPGLDASRREEIVRIAREAIVNAIRHGGAVRVDVLLERRGAELRLRIADNGCGISEQGLRKRHGFGLPTMRARAEALGGRLTARALVDGGTELAVVVPAAATNGLDSRVSDRHGRWRSCIQRSRLWRRRLRPSAPAPALGHVRLAAADGLDRIAGVDRSLRVRSIHSKPIRAGQI